MVVSDGMNSLGRWNQLMFTAYLIIGALSGVLSGMLGIGGGIIVVPGLAAVFLNSSPIPHEDIMQMAIGTSLAAMIVTTGSALLAHSRGGSVRWDIVRKIIPGLMIGAIIGVIIATYLPSKYLRIIFSFFLFYAAYRLLFAKYVDATRSFPSRFKMFTISGLIGTLASILGAGGGVMLIPFMLRYRVKLLEATGTSVACGCVLGIIATISFMAAGFFSPVNVEWSTGYIYWPAFLGVSIMSMIFAPIGTVLARKLPTVLLKRVLAFFLIAVGCKMLFF